MVFKVLCCWSRSTGRVSFDLVARLLLMLVLPGLSGCASRSMTAEDRAALLRPFYAITAPSSQELQTLEGLLDQGQTAGGRVEIYNGVKFRRVVLQGHYCLLFVSGVSVVNAAMTTQLALDHFPITHVLMFGMAGGVNPARETGDVVVPDRWAHHNEAAYVNPTLQGGWEVPPATASGPHFGMIFPETVTSIRAGMPAPQSIPAFEADRALVAAATQAGTTTALGRVTTGGVGVSGPAFVANREYRAWLYQVWGAQVVDLESTAAAQVCWANRIPFASVRVVTGLVGEPASKNALAVPSAEPGARLILAMLQNLPR